MIQQKQPAPPTARRDRHSVDGRDGGPLVRPYAGLEHFRVHSALTKHVIHVPLGQGEQIRSYLRGQHVTSEVMSPGQARYDRLEVDRGVNAEALQALLDERS